MPPFTGTRRRGPSLNESIWLGLLCGPLLGLGVPELAAHLGFLAQIFTRLLQMLVVPLVFSTLVMSIADRSTGPALGRIAVSCLVIFVAATTLAGVIGVAFANFLGPDQIGAVARGTMSDAPPAGVLPPFIETLIPTSVVQAMSSNGLLGLVFFTGLFALALRSIGPDADLIVRICSALASSMFRLTGYVMWFAPLGVLGATAYTVSQYGLEGLRPFVTLIVTAYAALGVFAALLLAILSAMGGFSPVRFLRALGDPLLLAFSTASSAAALPMAMERLELWGATRKVTAFVLPLGYGFNLTGTSLYLPLATIVWAHMNGISLSCGEQAVILAYILLVVRGLPTIPRALFLVWGAVLAQFHLPPEAVVVLLGIDPLIDMARTLVNVGGNCLAVAAIDRWDRAAVATREAAESPG